MKLSKRTAFLCKAMPLGIAISALFSMNVLAAQPGVVTADNVSIRIGPSAEAMIIGHASENQSVTIVSSQGDFYVVNTDTLSNVFISRAFIEHAESANQQKIGTVNGENINIRSGNSTASEIIGVANEGDTFPILATIDDWYRITYNSQPAYIFGEFLTVEEAAPETAEQVSLAQTAVAGYIAEEPEPDTMPSDFAALLASVWDNVDTEEDIDTTADEADNEPISAPVIDSDRTFNPQSNVHAVVSSSTGLNLRTSPTTESEAITILHPMQSLNVYDIFSDWARVSTMDGQNRGYVNVEFITVRTGSRQAPPPPNHEKAQQIIYFARMFIGTPYLFGGTDLESGVDCSGFIFSVMGEFGITLGRSSRDMINNGIPIEREDIAPGDLLFFSANGSVVTHVALYMGNGQFIHSTDTRGLGVSFSSLTNEHSQRTYFGARRVIK